MLHRPLNEIGLYSEADIRREISHKVRQAGGYKRFGEPLGLSGPFVHYVCAGEKKPPKSLLDMLGMRAVTVYVSKNDSRFARIPDATRPGPALGSTRKTEVYAHRTRKEGRTHDEVQAGETSDRTDHAAQGARGRDGV